MYKEKRYARAIRSARQAATAEAPDGPIVGALAPRLCRRRRPNLPPIPDVSSVAAWPQSDDRANLIVLRTALSAVVLNRFPYNNGHLLVAPLAHKGQLSDLSDDELLDLQQSLRRMIGRTFRGDAAGRI